MDWDKEPGLYYSYFEDDFDSGSGNDFSILNGCHVGYGRREIPFSTCDFWLRRFSKGFAFDEPPLGGLFDCIGVRSKENE